MIDVIIVEDDPMVLRINREYTQKFLEIQVVGAFQDGRKAWQHIQKTKPDLIILDIYMPHLTGMELLRQLRHENIKSDVIMVTAANDAAKVDEALKLGVIDYLIKPFEYQRFSEAVAKFLNKSNILEVGQRLSQNSIDRLMHLNTGGLAARSNALRKGIQQPTLNNIIVCLREEPGRAHTCETLSTKANLSKVTVRRYLNYLIEQEKLVSEIDYETGGRPSVVYRMARQCE